MKMSLIRVKKKENKKGFCFTLTGEKLEQTYNLSPEMKLKWLEDANEFINTALSKKKRRAWGRLMSKNRID